MVETDLQTFTGEQFEQLQRQYLSSRLFGNVPKVTDKSFEADGRKRSRVMRDAVNAGLLVATDESAWDGKVYEITPEVIASVIPASLSPFELWKSAHEQNTHREAYERPWIRVEDTAVDLQCAFLKSEEIDWFVVARTPYDYHASFADLAETVMTEARPSDAFNRYWAGPFATLEDAIARRKAISGSCLVASSPELREQVKAFFAELRIQKLFANNLLWGLVDIAQVPKDLLFGPDGKPTIDSQLEEGHSLRFSSNPNSPVARSDVEWEGNLAKSIERLKDRISKAEQKLAALRIVESSVQSSGGWAAFMDALEAQMRAYRDEDSIEI